MDNSIQQSNEWMSVPAFGDWENLKGMTDYTMDFSKIRESRKLTKSEYSRIYLGNDSELLSRSIAPAAAPAAANPSVHLQHSPPERKKFMSYFACCGRKIAS